MAEINISLEEGEQTIEAVEISNESGAISVAIENPQAEMGVTLASTSQTLRVGIDAQEDEITTAILTAANEAANAEQARQEAQQAAQDAQEYALRTSAAVNNINNNLGDVEDAVIALRARVNALEANSGTYVTDGEVVNSVGYFMNGSGDTLFTMEGMGGGGGSGSGDSSSSVVTLTNNTGWATYTAPADTDVILSLSWSSVEDGVATGDGTLTISVDGIVKEARNIQQGAFTVNVKEALTTGNNNVSIIVTDSTGRSKTKHFTITVVQMYITSSFDSSEVQTGVLNFSFTPYGGVSKTIHFEIDGRELDTVISSSSGRQMSYVISQQAHGAHVLRVWFTATINGQQVTSNTLYYDIIWVISGNNTPIIASNFSETTVGQYTTMTIPFMVYTPNSQVSDVVIKLDGATVQTFPDHGREMDSFQIRIDDIGEHTIRIQSGSAYKDIVLTVTEADMEAEAETEDLKLWLTSAGRSNSEAYPGTWTFTDASNNTTTATFSGFNWVSNGWVRDPDNITALRVNNGASVTIPFMPFQGDFRSTGYTIEMEFTVRDVQDYTQSILQCWSGNRGFNVTSQSARIKSEQSELEVLFKDEDHIRIAFVVEKRAEDKLLMAYINGIPSRVVQYPGNDNFAQSEPVGITISGANATVDVYNIRCYSNDLTGEQILGNWIADTQDGELMLQRYSRNNVYDEYGGIVISKLPGSLPYMIVQCEELPQYKGDKKTVSGSFTNPLDPSKSFTFTGCQMNVQGTSSAPYARKNYDMQFKEGFIMSSGATVENYQMTSTVKPFNRFVMKADVASSEGANNVELVKLYCELSPYKTREMEADSLVRQGIYGFPIVMFWTDTASGETTFLGKYNFNFPKRAPGPYGYSGNMESWEFQNNTEDLMLFLNDYFNETLKEDPTTGDVKETWLYDFEARFPDDTWKDYSKLQELETFVVSTRRDTATGDAITPVTYDGVTYSTDTAEYRLAKFRAEIGEYAEIQSLLFYYVFTEFFLLADSRAKNLFIGFSGSDTDPEKVTAIDRKAVCEPYDMDTALGINNEGSLAFTYSLEDSDHTSAGAEIFTGQKSILWKNVRDAFPNEIRQMYQTLRSGSKMNYSYVEGKFEEHQSVWPEAVWIEDSRYKYIDPLTNPDPGKQPTSAYLEMMQGSKYNQRRWWLSNRFKYMDSKWSSGDALSEVIQFRAYASSSLTITPYSDLYVTVKYGSYAGQERTTQGTPVTISVPIDNMSDTETYVYSASQIADVGDLSGFRLGWADFSHATRIQRIKIGDADANYENQPFTRLTLGNNRLLKVVDCRNCVNLGTGEMKSVDLTGCTAITEAYFDNTQIAGVSLPNASPIQKLHLPNTITSLILRNQTDLTDFTCAGFSNVATLWLENPASCIDTMAIVNAMADGGRVRLYNFYWELDDLDDVSDMFDKLDAMHGLDQNGLNTETAQVFGTIHIPQAIGSEITAIQSRYPDVRITYDHISANQYYYSWDGETLLYTEALEDDEVPEWTASPSRDDTAQYTFTFVGWALQQDASEADPAVRTALTADRYVYAAYSRVVHTYTVTFVKASADGGGTLQSQTVAYGDIPSYTGTTPVSSQGEEFVFNGWSPEIGPVTGAVTYTAVFRDTRSAVVAYLARTMREYRSGSATTIGIGAFYSYSTLTSVETTATTIEYQAFRNCANLETVDLKAESGTVYIGNDAFNGCTNLTALIIRSNSVATLTNVYALPADNFNVTKSGAIYVPAGLVASYKAATNWSNFANRIYPISMYPVTNFDTITDSVEQMGAKLQAGTADYNVGDVKTIAMGTEGTVKLIVIAKDTDVLASGTGTAPYTFWAVKMPSTNHRMNPALDGTTEGTGTIGGWEKCEMRAYLRETLLPMLPEALQNAIKPVTKYSSGYNTNGEMVANMETTETIFLLSEKEVNNSSGYETQGVTYSGYFTSSANKIAYNQSGSAYYWWLRSASDTAAWRYKTNGGSTGNYNTGSAIGVAFAFCA